MHNLNEFEQSLVVLALSDTIICIIFGSAKRSQPDPLPAEPCRG